MPLACDASSSARFRPRCCLSHQATPIFCYLAVHDPNDSICAPRQLLVVGHDEERGLLRAMLWRRKKYRELVIILAALGLLLQLAIPG